MEKKPRIILSVQISCNSFQIRSTCPVLDYSNFPAPLIYSVMILLSDFTVDLLFCVSGNSLLAQVWIFSHCWSLKALYSPVYVDVACFSCCMSCYKQWEKLKSLVTMVIQTVVLNYGYAAGKRVGFVRARRDRSPVLQQDTTGTFRGKFTRISILLLLIFFLNNLFDLSTFNHLPSTRNAPCIDLIQGATPPLPIPPPAVVERLRRLRNTFMRTWPRS